MTSTSTLVFFDVPPALEAGLNAGFLERIGGVIREADTKQVVAWLRETPLAPTGNYPTSFQTLLRSSSVNTWTALNTFTPTGQIVNLGMATVSLYLTLQRLNQLSDEITQLGTAIAAEFNRDRDLRFKVALQAARDTFESDPSTYRENSARSALDGLYEARENFLHDFEVALGSNSSQRLLVAKHALIHAFYAEISRIRCYLSIKPLQDALHRLKEDRRIFRDAVVRLVNEWLGGKQALYFHKEVAPEDVERFLRVRHWMMNPDDTTSVDTTTSTLKVIHELRGDFWNEAFIADEYDHFVNQLTRRPVRTLANRLAELPQILSAVETLVENYQRLLGFELELRSLRLSFQEWQEKIPHAQWQQHDIAILIDEDALNATTSRIDMHTKDDAAENNSTFESG